MLDESEVRAMLAARYVEAGSLKAVADAAGVGVSYVHDALSGRRSVGPALLKLLGLEKVTGYREVGAVPRAGDGNTPNRGE